MEVATEFETPKKAKKPKKGPNKQAIKEAVKKAKKSLEEFDRAAHNRKISRNRSDEWKSKLKFAKLGDNASLLAWERTVKNISQREMVKKSSVGTQVTYGRIERGERKATKKNAESIAKVLGVKISEIFEAVDKDHYKIIK